MSRFLISTLDAAGHVTPALAVARSLVEQGHVVLWHTGPQFAARVEETGARFVAMDRAPGMAQLPPEPAPGTSGAAEAVSALRALLVDRMPGQLADYEAILREQPVDAVLVDLAALGGRALHERHGIPWATLGISPFTAPAAEIPPFGSGRMPPSGPLGRLGNRLYARAGDVFLRGLDRAYDEQRRAVGLPPLRRHRGIATFRHMLSDQLHLQAATPSIEYPRDPWPGHVHLVGPLLPPAPTSFEPPAWWDELAGAGRVVHVTQGTVATDPALLVRPTLEALAGSDGMVVVTTPDPEALGPVPANVRLARFVPHALLLPHVDVMVGNGGYNGAKIALAHGVPQVFAPWGNDQPDVAARVARAGAAIDLRVRTPAPATIRAAVERVLAEPGYRAAARRVADEFSGYPGGGIAAGLLGDLARGADQPTAVRSA